MDKNIDSELMNKILEKHGDKAFVEHLLSSLFNTFPDHIYLKDRQSRFILVNESLTSFFNLKQPKDVIGKSDFDFFSEEHSAKAYKDEQEIMESGKGRINFIEKETREDGGDTWVASTKVPFSNEQGKVIGLFGISRDITARRKAEIEMNNRAQELDCFIKIARISKQKDISFEGHFKEITDILSHSLSHAGIHSARIIIGNSAFRNTDFKEKGKSLRYRIKDGHLKIGTLEVFLESTTGEIGNTTEQVLKLVADRINEVAQKKWIEKDLRKWEHILRDAEDHKDLYP